MQRPYFKVGLVQKCLRSLTGYAPFRQHAAQLAAKLYDPEATVSREFTIDYHGLQYRGETRNRIDWCVFFLKNFAEAESKFVKGVHNFVRRKQETFVCYDIGAHVGQRTLPMATIATRVIATEPAKGAAGRLREKLHANKLSHVSLFNVAFSDQDGNVEVDVLSPADFVLARKDNPLLQGGFGSDFIQVVRGDRFIAKHQLPAPDFMRISSTSDLLGMLKGLHETLRAARPILLIGRPASASDKAINVEALKAALYEDVQISTFSECLLSGAFALEPFNPRARKLVCYPKDLERMAELEACKRMSHRLKPEGAIQG